MVSMLRISMSLILIMQKLLRYTALLKYKSKTQIAIAKSGKNISNESPKQTNKRQE